MQIACRQVSITSELRCAITDLGSRRVEPVRISLSALPVTSLAEAFTLGYVNLRSFVRLTIERFLGRAIVWKLLLPQGYFRRVRQHPMPNLKGGCHDQKTQVR